MSVHIGTSGWVYQHWRKRFYPSEFKRDEWLSYYTHHFDTVEVNNSFYRLPSRQTFAKWANQTTKNFSFAVKGHRFITHMKKLKGVGEPLERFFGSADGLGQKLTVVLWQLPPNLKADAKRLDDFLGLLPRHYIHAVEFRHVSWWQDKASIETLERHQAVHCIPIAPPFPKTLADIVTSKVVYLRFHGWDKIYTSCFPDEELMWWSERIKNWDKQGFKVFAYFNNDAEAFAVQNAKTLTQMLM